MNILENDFFSKVLFLADAAASFTYGSKSCLRID